MRPKCAFVLATMTLLGVAEWLPSAPAPREVRPRKAESATEWGRLRGTWEVVRFEVRGEPDGEVVGQRVFIGRETFRLWGSYPPMTCRVDRGERHRLIDARGGPTEEYPADLTLHGIYRLDGDTLTVCFSTQTFPRPDQFRTGDDVPAIILTLRRVGGKR